LCEAVGNISAERGGGLEDRGGVVVGEAEAGEGGSGDGMRCCRAYGRVNGHVMYSKLFSLLSLEAVELDSRQPDK